MKTSDQAAWPRSGTRQGFGTRQAVAVAHADISTRTLRRYISHGRLTGYRVGPRLIKVDLNEVDAMVLPIPTASTPRAND